MNSKTNIVARLATIASFSALVSFCGTSLALTESAFGYNVSAAGDWGCNDNTKKSVHNLDNKGPELVLGLGDYSYQSTANCWFDIIEPIDGKMKIAIGNHDDSSSTLLNQYLSHFGLSRQYYSFNYQNAYFLVLSTEMIASDVQYDFAKSDLAKAASNTGIQWIIVYMHKPMYTSPSHHSADSTMRSKYHPLFDQYGVDLVLYGHNHAYERSYPIKYDSSTPSTPIITSTNEASYTNPTGAIFATVGTAGASLYSYSSKSSYIVTQYEGYGFLDITISGSTLAGKFYANSDGSIKDQFTIEKSTLGSSAPPESSPDSNSTLDGILNNILG
jgi:predicted phosphodiesterase